MLQKKKENIYFVLFLVNFSLTVTFIHITFRSLKISYSLLPSLVGFKTSAVGLTATSLIMRVPFFSIRFFVFCCIKFYSDEQLWIKKKKILLLFLKSIDDVCYPVQKTFLSLSYWIWPLPHSILPSLWNSIQT